MASGEFNFPGSGLTVEISPLSFPNRNVFLRGCMPRWKCPVYVPVILRPSYKSCAVLHVQRNCPLFITRQTRIFAASSIL